MIKRLLITTVIVSFLIVGRGADFVNVEMTNFIKKENLEVVLNESYFLNDLLRYMVKDELILTNNADMTYKEFYCPAIPGNKTTYKYALERCRSKLCAFNHYFQKIKLNNALGNIEQVIPTQIYKHTFKTYQEIQTQINTICTDLTKLWEDSKENDNFVDAYKFYTAKTDIFDGTLVFDITDFKLPRIKNVIQFNNLVTQDVDQQAIKLSTENARDDHPHETEHYIKYDGCTVKTCGRISATDNRATYHLQAKEGQTPVEKPFEKYYPVYKSANSGLVQFGNYYFNFIRTKDKHFRLEDHLQCVDNSADKSIYLRNVGKNEKGTESVDANLKLGGQINIETSYNLYSLAFIPLYLNDLNSNTATLKCELWYISTEKVEDSITASEPIIVANMIIVDSKSNRRRII